MFISRFGGIAELKINPAGPARPAGFFISVGDALDQTMVASPACRFALAPPSGAENDDDDQ
jgi:hypothetical protein